MGAEKMEERIFMNKKHLRLWLLLMCLVIAVCVLAGCKKKAKKTEAPTTTTTAATEETEPTDSVETTTEAPTETTTEATTTTEEPTTTTESTKETTEATKKSKESSKETAAPTEAPIDEDGTYTSKDDVALYIHTYGHLPKNFVTKKEAQAKGWEGGSLEDYFPGASIGGDKFGNREGLLPTKKGRTYTECDIDTKGKKSRGAKRIVFSNDGLIYYTDDHYETFTLLYGEE